MAPNEHLKNREWMVASLAGEVFGPGGRFEGWKNDLYSEATEFIPLPGYTFESWDDYNRRYVQAGTRDEILKDEGPLRHYGVGVLFPDDEKNSMTDEPDESDAAEVAAAGEVRDEVANAGDNADKSPKYEQELRSRAVKLAETICKHTADEDEVSSDEETDPYGVGLSRIGKPRSMGVSFAVDLAGKGSLEIRLSGARYKPVDGIRVKREEFAGLEKKMGRTWWLRVPVSTVMSFTFEELRCGENITRDLILEPSIVEGLASLNMTVSIIVRKLDSEIAALSLDGARLLTVTVVNRTRIGVKAADCCALYQSRFTVTPTRHDEMPVIIPYPGLSRRKLDEEEESLELLYRKVKVFAAGHGCAGDWIAEENADRAVSVIAEPLPAFEAPPVTPDFVDPKTGDPFRIRMAPLANLTDDGREALQPLIELADLYEAWIKTRESEVKDLDARYRSAANRHINAARSCLLRIRDGLELLIRDDGAWFVFRLTNRAILTQQVAGNLGKRVISYDERARRLIWSKDYKVPDPDGADGSNRAWRPFQIAFLLMSVKGLWDGASENSDRDIADLIWFPTGGGKTEAYLGASAFALFARRLHNPNDGGVGVLMRYTLRLLTAQQFQRAAGLVCAMEMIRRSHSAKLGVIPFRIGIWVGGATTPNSNAQSVKKYNEAMQHGAEAYSHVLLRCPWCGSVMGPRKKNRRDHVLDGLSLSGRGAARKVVLHCPDPACDFYDELPVRVVDEEIYEDPPSLIIGTVDKFAMLAWKPEARNIFGINAAGERKVSPPGLIIQDELHLITGPLGSMVGLYEGLIEELCTDKRGGKLVVPKLIASTATTRASTRQIRDLYARAKTAVFPPPGLDADDSFFAKYDRDKITGKIKPGRLYLGVLARGYGSGLTVNVRVYAALLAAAARIEDTDQRDPWWTLLLFYNSLRELGADLTLFGADIPERLKDLQRRWHPSDNRRFLREVAELTGRLSNSEVPQAIDKLERIVGKDACPVDACLASNIIEVGVDVSRLGIMAVSGQPKTMAQYIQATGRVGRGHERPGLIVMVYANRKARDLSHYEHFRADHSRLYAQVEPASVTPYTLQVLERALHGVFIAWLRQMLPESRIDRPVPFEVYLNSVRECFTHLLKRVQLLLKSDNAALTHAESMLRNMFNRRVKEWKDAGAMVWDNPDLVGDSGDQPLMRFYGTSCKIEWIDKAWETPTSMRGVDAECPATIFSPNNESGECEEGAGFI